MGSSLFARRYWGNRFFFLFLRVLRCFSSPGCLLMAILFTIGSSNITSMGFSHSDICESSLACSSSQLFAAYRVLLRLLAPRHPPNALSSLTFRCLLLSNSSFLAIGGMVIFFPFLALLPFSRSELFSTCVSLSLFACSFFPLWLLLSFSVLCSFQRAFLASFF